MNTGEKLLAKMNHDRKVTKLYCDVQIEVDDVVFDAHRCILSCLSEFFDRMFRSSMKEGDAQKIRIVGPLGEEISSKTMLHILSYVYTESIFLSCDNVYNVLLAADYMDFPVIKNACSEFLCNNMSLNTCIKNYLVGSRFNDSILLSSSSCFLFQNFHSLFQTQSFKELSFSQLKNILKLVTKSEKDLTEKDKYSAIKTWINFDVLRRNEHIDELLSHVDFEKIPFQVLQKLFEMDGLIKESKNAMICITEMLLERQLLLKVVLEEHAGVNRQSHTAKIWMIGGYCRPHQYVEFDIETCQFRGFPSRSKLPCPVIGACAENVGETVYIASGQKIQKIDAKNPAPTVVAELTVLRNHCAGAYLDGFFFVVGGRDSECVHDSIDVYMPALNTINMFGNLTKRRYKHAVAGVSTSMYVMGGTDDSSTALSHVECFDTITRKSKQMSSMGACRKDFCAVALKGYIIAIGGYNEHDEVLNTVEIYNPKSDRWTTLNPMICARAGASACLVNEMIFVIGGKGKSNDETSIESYNLVLDKWTTVIDMSVSRYHASCVVVE